MAKKKEKSKQEHAATSNTKVALLGAGKMGGILLQAFLNKGLFRPENIRATVQHPERAAALAKQWGVSVSTDNLAAARNSDLILLGVKPQTVPEVLQQIRPALTVKKTIISFAASVKTGAIEKAAGVDLAVIRAMPNTPSLVGCGATALCRGKFVTDEQLAVAEKVFASVGRTVTVDEKHMDAVTALSASGPAYIYIILESLAEGGVKVGLPRDIATLLAAQMVLGAATMVLETGSHPALLKDAVTTPAGCTIDGILELEEGGVRVTLIKAVMRAAQRAKELASS
ncbi:MAG TPA: pyrroline-5-carboxylate reductase [Acidobacteriaceae bacterium]|jgi:pyrroline-5-carboxylate reductase